MQKMLQIYFSEKRIWLYLAIVAGLFIYLLASGLFEQYWYYSLITIPLAPFYEWLAHKYILHWNIGTIQKLPKAQYPDSKKGDRITIEHGGKTIDTHVLTADKDAVIVGSGLAAKIPYFYYFMDDLHYHHHRDPDYIPLVFAPTLPALLLFAKMGLLAFLISWNVGITLSFELGVIVYYLFYEWMHLGHHVKGYNHLTAYGKRMKKAHQLHHYKNENYWWGITNPVGDMLLGTYKENDAVPKSKSVKKINV